jgi:NADH:ubiquinone oxidoreductase subunit E
VTSKRSRTLTETIEAFRPQPGKSANILQTLLAIQEAHRFVPPEAIPQVAHVLGVTDADVAGVLSYYPDLRTAPPGRHVIRVCMGESCLANHCHKIFRAVQDYLGPDGIGSTSSNRFTLEKVYCMGNCALSPTIVVDRDVLGRVEPAQIPFLMERYR